MLIGHFKSWPLYRDARLETKCAALQSKPQDRFNCNSVEPTRRPGVPRPPAAACVWRSAVYISADHVRFNFVIVSLLSCRGMVDRVDKVPKLHGAVAVTLQGCCQHHPGSSVGILTAILTDTWHISFDVARLKNPFVERGIKQLDQFVVDTHQSVFNGVHCRLSPCRVGFP